MLIWFFVDLNYVFDLVSILLLFLFNLLVGLLVIPRHFDTSFKRREGLLTTRGGGLLTTRREGLLTTRREGLLTTRRGGL